MAKINIDKITYNQMLKAFLAFNIVIVFIVFFFINSSLRTENRSSNIKGDSATKTSEESKTQIKTKDFIAPLSKVSFKYPESWGLAVSNSKESPCSEKDLIEDITFPDLQNFIITINACNLAQDSFLNENEFIVTNDQKTIKFIGNFETNYKYEGQTTLSMKSTTSNKPLILIKALFDEKVVSREEIRESAEILIKSITFN